MKYSIFALLLILASCSSQEKSEEDVILPRTLVDQRFRMNLHSEPTSLDPRLVRDIPSVTTAKMFFDGLMRMDLNRKVVLSIAEKVTVSEDKMRYTFHLRDAEWSDGSPITAYDFEYSWKKVLSPNFPAEYAHQLFVIKNGENAKKKLCSVQEVGVTAESAKKLVVELVAPNPFFLEIVASAVSYPVSHEVEIVNSNWAQEKGDAFVCSGPFHLVNWRHGSDLNALKNPRYWDKAAVKLDSIVLTMIEDEHTELNMYENSELDWAGSPNSSIPPEALPSLKAGVKGQNELHISPVAGTFCYKFNTKAEPFDSLKMRKAFAMAINRQSLVDNVLQANQLVASSLLPPCMQGSVNDGLHKTDDKEAAVALFEEALSEKGWTRETLPSITLIFSKSEKHQKVAQAVQQEWNLTFGIKVNLQSFEWNTFLQRLSKHEYQVGGKGFISDLSDPKTLLEIYKFTNDPELGGNNDTQWENREFIALIDQASETSDPVQRKMFLEKAEKILLDEMPIAPLYHSTACYLKKPYVKDVYMSELCDLDFKHAYIDSAIK